MKKTCCALLILIYPVFIAYAQEDSLQIVNEIKTVKKDISGVKYSVYQQNEFQQKMMDSLLLWHGAQKESFALLLDRLATQQENLEATNDMLTRLNQETNAMHAKQRRNSLVNYILHGFLLLLILFLIIYLLIQRQKSLDFLLSRANKLSGQNDEILEKAEELNAIKKSLKEVVESQKKTNKALKKKKKK